MNFVSKSYQIITAEVDATVAELALKANASVKMDGLTVLVFSDKR